MPMFHTISNVYFEFSKSFIVSAKLILYFFTSSTFHANQGLFIHISLIYLKLSKLNNSADGSKREMTY